MDIFLEYIVSKKKTPRDYAIVYATVIGACLASWLLLFLTVVFMRYATILVLLIAAAWWGAVKLIKSRSVEFEYIMTNADFDIDKIIAKGARKRLCTINFKKIERCASVNDPAFANVYNNTSGTTVKNYVGDMDADRVYFVDYFKDAERVRVIFQPSEKMLEAMKTVNPRLVNIYEGTKQ